MYFKLRIEYSEILPLFGRPEMPLHFIQPYLTAADKDEADSIALHNRRPKVKRVDSSLCICHTGDLAGCPYHSPRPGSA